MQSCRSGDGSITDGGMNCWPCEPGADLRCRQGFSAREAYSNPSLAKKYYLFHTESIVSGDEKDPAGLLWHSSWKASQFGACGALTENRESYYPIASPLTVRATYRAVNRSINTYREEMPCRWQSLPSFFLLHLFARTHSEIFVVLSELLSGRPFLV